MLSKTVILLLKIAVFRIYISKLDHHRVLTTLDNLEISENLLILENSGKTQEFKIYSGNLSDACCFFVTQSETHKKT